MTPAIGGFVAETRNSIETPTGATVRLRRQGRPSDLEYFADVERNGETVTLCKAEPREVAQFWANLTAEIDDHGTRQPEKKDPWEFDEYGPDRRKPLPAGEAARQNWRIQLRKRGFSPNALIEAESHGGLPDYHIDDRRRPGNWEVERETLAEIESERDGPEPDREHSTARAVADGGAECVADDPPGDETVRLIRGIVGKMHTPRTVEGQTSSTGKTISTETIGDDTARLDAETIFNGESEFRDSVYFELYTPERMQRAQRSNKAPGPRAGTNGISDRDELAEPTHVPPEYEPDDLTDDDEDEDADEGDRTDWPGSGAMLELHGRDGRYNVLRQTTPPIGDKPSGMVVIDEDLTAYEVKRWPGDGYRFKHEDDNPPVVNVDAETSVEGWDVIDEDDPEILQEYTRQQFEQNAERVKSD